MTHRWLPDVAGYAVMWSPGRIAIFERDENGRVEIDRDPVMVTLNEFRDIGQHALLAENMHAIREELKHHAQEATL